VWITALVVGSGVLVVAPGLALVAALGDWLPESLAPAGVVGGSSLAGWLLFSAWFAGPRVGLATTVCIEVAAAFVLTVRPVDLRATRSLLPLLTFAAVLVVFACLSSDRGGFDRGAEMIAPRYWPAVDNELPEILANNLLDGRDSRPQLIPGWQSSDRPPLQAGMLMLAYPLAGARPPAALSLGIAINGLWVLGLWSVLRS
jgi:hypothetical protein